MDDTILFLDPPGPAARTKPVEHFPDVCWTLPGQTAQPVPIPYPNIGHAPAKDTATTAEATPVWTVEEADLFG